MAPQVWLLSAYRSDSHAYWVDGLVRRHREIDWRVFELPGRHFAWRIRSNPLSWLDDIQAHLSAGGSAPDLILATSMVDLATLKGLHPGLASTPSLLYFHENQLAYPIIPGQVQSIEPAMVQIYAALAADGLLFNSRFNRDSFLTGLDALTRRLPDGIPGGLAERLEKKSRVLPVAVEPIEEPSDHRSSTGPRRGAGAPLILWAHRWEHDKRPDRFAEAVIALDQAGQNFQLALLGPRGPSAHPALARLRQTLAHRIAVDGFVDRLAYEDWLRRSSIVISTADHEFQGISLLEAVSAGAWPLVPDRLCYPEQYPVDARYDPDRPQALTRHLLAALALPARRAPSIDNWLAPRLGPRWAKLLAEQTRG
jgi:glycosyltransferase involved in cell wall biosynthesis